MTNTTAYQQGILRFTPPGEFSQGFDFTPLWLQIDNPSSYYISFPQAPSLGTIPPYYTGVIVAWNQANLTVNVLASPGASGSPSLPTSNAEVTVLATNNPSLGVSPGTPLPVFQQGKVVWAPVIPSSTSTGESFTYTPAPNATGIAFLSQGNVSGNLTSISVVGNTTSYAYIEESMSGGLADPVWFVSPIIGDFEQLVLSYSNFSGSGGSVGWFIELYNNALTISSSPISQPLIVAGPPIFNPVTGGFYPPVMVAGAGVNNAVPWSSTTTYYHGNIVFITTGTAPGFYFCVTSNTNVEPPNTSYWFPMTLTLMN